MKFRSYFTCEFFLVSSFFTFSILLWTFMPFRNKPWFASSLKSSNINEFISIKLTKESSSIIQYFQKEFGNDLKGENLLITGRLPVLYFALGSSPTTCMSYFHLLPNQRFLKSFQNCLETKSPKTILSIIAYEQKKIYTKQITNEKKQLKNNFLQVILNGSEKVRNKTKIIYRKYIKRKPITQTLNQIHPKVNNFVAEYIRSNSYTSCKTKSIPESIVKDLNFIYPNATNIEYRLCKK